MGLMPVLSTFARLFWAVVIFLAGWNKEIQMYIKTLGGNLLNAQAEQRNGVSIRIDMTLKRIGELLFTKYLTEGERKQDSLFLHSPFSQSLHCWIWCNPLQPPLICLKVSASGKQSNNYIIKGIMWRHSNMGWRHTKDKPAHLTLV